MHIVAGVLAALAAVYFFVLRARGAAEMTHKLMDVADDVRAAARRLGFARRPAAHPMEAVEAPNIAAATLAVAFQELDGLPTESDRSRLLMSLQSRLDVSLQEAEELATLGRWLMGECRGPEPAISRAGRKLFKLTSGDIGPMMPMLDDIAPESGPTERQTDAREELRRAFRLPASA